MPITHRHGKPPDDEAPLELGSVRRQVVVSTVSQGRPLFQCRTSVRPPSRRFSSAFMSADWSPLNDRVETQVILRDEGGRTVHFQEWWVRLHAAVPAAGFVLAGAEDAAPAAGVLEAIGDADVVLFPPSNPVVSVGTILAVPGIADAVRAKTVVGVSPIIGGAPVRGMADKCLAAIGVETSATGVGAHYGPALLDGWVVDERDKTAVDAPELAGIAVRAVPLYMTDLPAAAAIARAALDLAQELTA